MKLELGEIIKFCVVVIVVAVPAAYAFVKLWAEAWINHRFEKALAHINSQHQLELAGLTSRLNLQAEQISALQSGALAAMMSRHQALDARRQNAVDKVWVVATKISSLSHILPIIGAMIEVYKNLEEMSPADKAKISKIIKDLGFLGEEKELAAVLESAQNEQLYFDVLTWQTFASLKNIFVFARLQMHLMANGHNPLKIDIGKTILEPLISVLPEQKDYIEKFGEAAAYNLVAAVYTKLWQQLQFVLDGEDTDKKMLRSTENLMLASYDTTLQLNLAAVLPNEVRQQLDKTRKAAG